MKHTKKVTLILIALFFVAQLIGLFVVDAYRPVIIQEEVNGTLQNYTSHNLPYGVEPPSDLTGGQSLTSILISLAAAVALMLVLMKFKAAVVLRIWFFVVIILALAIAFNAFFQDIPYASLFSLAVALPLAYLKVFRRNIIVHNFTELLIYPGIAAIFVPLLSLWVMIVLLILISLWDMYAVWHAKVMQKMAHYQINVVKVFGGFFIPYLDKKQRALLVKAKTAKAKSKIKVHVAILGGGDIVFPIMLAGIVFWTVSLPAAIIVSLGATVALATLFHFSEKGKFYPAMPFISTGCLVGLGIVYLFF